MTPLSCLIVDDVQNNRNFLISILNKYYPEIAITGSASSVQQGLEMIREQKPDILFLDIELTDGLGFDLLRSFPEPVLTIITSAYKDYAFEAFRHNVVDYLVKPLDIAQLDKAIQKVKERLRYEEKDLAQPPQQPEVILPKEMIAVTSKAGIDFIMVTDIEFLEADGKYTRLGINNGQVLISSKHMKEIEALLPSNFVRVHHSFIVNLLYCKSFLKESYTILLQDGKEIPVSVRKRDVFLQLFNKI